jgi:hypothetical protein
LALDHSPSTRREAVRRHQQHQALDEFRMLRGEALGDEAAERDAHDDVRRRRDGATHVPHDLIEARGGVAQDCEAVTGKQARDLPGVPSGIRRLVEPAQQRIDAKEDHRFPLAGSAANVRHPVSEQAGFDCLQLPFAHPLTPRAHPQGIVPRAAE